MSREEFEAYVEQTFRYHNSLVNELIMTSSLGADDFEFSDAIHRAEEDMAHVCQPLNDMVSATIEGREVSFWRKLLLLNQVPECEAATQRLERLLQEHE